jgi:hypothetical protein
MTLLEGKHPSTRTINGLGRPTRRIVGATLAVALDVWSYCPGLAITLPGPCGRPGLAVAGLAITLPGPCGRPYPGLAVAGLAITLPGPCDHLALDCGCWTCGRPGCVVALALNL